MAAPLPKARVILAAVVIAAFFVLILPVFAIYFRALSTGESAGGGALFDYGRQLPLLGRSLTVAGGAALVALALGVVVGFAATGLQRIARTAMAAACAMSLLIPPYVYAVAWIDLWGPAGWLFRWSPVEIPAPGSVVYSVPGAIVTLGAAYYPIVAFAAYTGFRRLNPRWRDAAMLAGSRGRYVRSIALPLLARPIGAGALAVFLFALYEFPVHSLLQVDTYLVEIYAAAEYHDYRAAALLSLPLLFVSVVTVGTVGLLLRGHRSDVGFDARESQRGVGVKSMAWLVTIAAGMLPLFAVAYRAMPPSNFARLLETAWAELFWSALLASNAAAIVILLGTASALALQRRSVRSTFDAVSALPFLVSGPLFGLGVIALYNRPGLPGTVYDSVWILVIAWTAQFLFIGQWGIGAAVRSQSRSVHEAAEVSGVSWLRTQALVTIPLALPYAALVMAAVFVFSFREVGTAVLVVPPGAELASVRLFTLMHYGPDGYVMAMAIAMCAISLIAGGFFVDTAVRWKRFTDASAE